MEPPEGTRRWLGKIGKDLKDKLAAVEFCEGGSGQSGLADFLDKYIAGGADAKPRTIANLKQTQNKLVAFFTAGRRLRGITPGYADAFAINLKAKHATATAARMIKHCRQFFTAAGRSNLIEKNPFADVKARAMENPALAFFVTREMTEQVLETCPNAQWRPLVALCRDGGLRRPSEPLALTWADMDWERNRFKVTSPKMARTTKATRSLAQSGAESTCQERTGQRDGTEKGPQMQPLALPVIYCPFVHIPPRGVEPLF